jgi:TrmH family RNA methyltransferase
VLATTLDGQNIFDAEKLPDKAIVLIGNESQGLSEELLQLSTRRFTIPPARVHGDAGLNAAVAAGIVLSAFRK